VLYCFAYERTRGQANSVRRGRGKQEAGKECERTGKKTSGQKQHPAHSTLGLILALPQ
jgi:hypothetical protein